MVKNFWDLRRFDPSSQIPNFHRSGHNIHFLNLVGVLRLLYTYKIIGHVNSFRISSVSGNQYIYTKYTNEDIR